MECDDVEALYLDFTTAVWMLGVTDIVELKENGSNIAVTNDNREVSFFNFLIFLGMCIVLITKHKEYERITLCMHIQ